jgi:hypothetical protein
VSAAAGALLVVAALAGALVLARRRAAPTAAATVAVVQRQPLARDCGVALVRWDDRELLVGYGAAGVTLVARPRAEETP